MGATVNKFFDTAVGKSVETLLWTLAAYGITVAVALLAKYHWSPELVAIGVPGLLNWVLYTAKVIVDKEVPTLPSSQPMMLVPKATQQAPVQPVTLQPVDLPADAIDAVTNVLQKDLNLNPPAAPEVPAAPVVPPVETAPVDQPQAPVS